MFLTSRFKTTFTLCCLWPGQSKTSSSRANDLCLSFSLTDRGNVCGQMGKRCDYTKRLKSVRLFPSQSHKNTEFMKKEKRECSLFLRGWIQWQSSLVCIFICITECRPGQMGHCPPPTCSGRNTSWLFKWKEDGQWRTGLASFIVLLR